MLSSDLPLVKKVLDGQWHQGMTRFCKENLGQMMRPKYNTKDTSSSQATIHRTKQWHDI
ncbi:hypothetical protein Goshw_011451 [Gossypium schwendimanii]|uniref:Uncharacterized protein n=1 Tax=Gossypium schwendimanii TaxID=34291 RepID=A0A7J9LF64_GOSSC|nr:hypothetical protein [Gossypium schwendimanii]